MIAACGHAVEVSVTANVTARGAVPDAGATARVALVTPVAPVTVIGTDWRTLSVPESVMVATYEPAVLYEYVNTCGVRPVQEIVTGIAVTGAVPSPAESMMAACEHAADVSVTVKVTASGTMPEVGATESVALVAAPVVPPVTVTVTD